MSEPIIEVENLGKKYLISHHAGPRFGKYVALRDVITDRVKLMGRRLLRRSERQGGGTPEREEFWALREINFALQPGEVLGIIGRNGAGKSTLLKLLSRITEPSAGRITLRGRVASLLEVGTGFHPELTGRENIFLNGAILGMAREEIRRKFDEIVAFAEVERFLDTPVKRFSSGMYVRLAFAVAAHLDPEILVVDEVLAVGDINFQRKCLGKMKDVAQSANRTVLFVSHNLSSISRLCSKAMLLDGGRMLTMGPTEDTVRIYREMNAAVVAEQRTQQRDLWKNQGLRVEEVEFFPRHLTILSELKVTITFRALTELPAEYSVFCNFSDGEGVYYGSVFSKDELLFYSFEENGLMKVQLSLDFHTFLPGTYRVETGLFNKLGEILAWIDTGREIEVHSEMFNGFPFDRRTGYATLRGHWSQVSATEDRESEMAPAGSASETRPGLENRAE